MRILYLSYDWRNMAQLDPSEATRRLVRDGLDPKTNHILMLQIGTKRFSGKVSHNVMAKTFSFPLKHVRPLSDIALGIYALRHTKHEFYDTVVCADPALLWWVRFAKRKYAVVLYLNTLHRILARKTFRIARSFYVIFTEWLVRRTISRCIVLSASGKEYARKYLNMREDATHEFLPNTFSELSAIGTPRDIRVLHGIPRDIFLTLSVSRLEKEKGVDRLLRSVAQAGTSVGCLLVGEGSERDHLSSLCESLGIQGRIWFVGAVPHDQLSDYYRCADMVAQCSLSESLGLSILEAMYLNIPVAASPVGGLRDSIGSVYERGFAINTPQDFIHAVHTVQAGGVAVEMMKGRAHQYVTERLYSFKTINHLFEQ